MAITDIGVSLLIKSSSMDISQISTALEIASAETFAKGSPMSLRQGAHAHQVSVWKLRGQALADAPLAVHLGDVLDRVESKAERIRELASQCSVEIWVSASMIGGQSSGLDIDAQAMTRAGRLGATLIFDIYTE
jgi:hypothetical protein